MSQPTGNTMKKVNANTAVNTKKQDKQDLESSSRVQALAAGPKFTSRTLPREILKWIQVLDLSYSVKDARKDLCNGFLVAEIFQRYYPLKVQMHSFDNSHNFERRQNNWTLLQLMFTKNEIPIQKSDWEPILKDEDMESIISFMGKIFTILTQKKITKPPLANYVNSKEFLTNTQSAENKSTTSYLLKEKGLERLEEKSIKQEEASMQNDGQNQDKKVDASSVLSENNNNNNNTNAKLNHSSKRTNFLRVPSKPISQNIESLTHQIDVKNITVKQVQGSILKLRDNKMLPNDQQNNLPDITAGMDRLGNIAGNKSLLSPQINNNLNLNLEASAKSQNQIDSNSAYMSSQENTKKKEKHVEQTIMDILNNMLLIRFQQGQNNEEVKKIRGKNINLASAFADQVNEFSDEFVGSFLSEILQQKDAFISFLFKETNNLWTFFNFAFTCLYNLSHTKQSLVILGEFIKGFGEKSLQRDPNKTKNIFVEFFLPGLADQIKQAVYFQKKEILIQTIYSFCPNDPASKHSMISSVKECLGDMNTFMQVLVVLFQFEEQYSEYNKLIIDDFLLFANQNLFASATNLRTMSLALISHAATLRPDLVLNQLIHKIEPIAKNTWWECKCLAIVVFSKVIKGILNSDRYASLVKNPSANQKFFSIENERMISEMKEQIDKFARGIYLASFPPSSTIILSTTFIYIVEHIGECKILLELFLNLILNCSSSTRNWVLHSDTDGNLNNNNTLQTSGFHSNLNVSQDKIEVNGQPQSQQQQRQQQQQNQLSPNNNIIQDDEDKEQMEQLNMLNNPSSAKEADSFQYLVNSCRSLKYKSQINSGIIKTFASQILQLFVAYIKEHEKELEQLSQEHMDIVLFCFEHTDFKVINMESCETIANTLKEYILISLCDSALCEQGKIVQLKLLDLQFYSDVKLQVINKISKMIPFFQLLKDSENLFGSTIGLIYKNRIEETMENMEDIVSHLVDQAYNHGVEVVKQFLIDSVSYLYQKKMMQFIQDTRMAEILARSIASFEETHSQNQSQDNGLDGGSGLDSNTTKEQVQQQQQQPQAQPTKAPSSSSTGRKSIQKPEGGNSNPTSARNMQMIQEKPLDKEESIVA